MKVWISKTLPLAFVDLVAVEVANLIELLFIKELDIVSICLLFHRSERIHTQLFL